MKKKSNKKQNFCSKGQNWKKMSLPPVRRTNFYRRIGNKD